MDEKVKRGRGVKRVKHTFVDAEGRPVDIVTKEARVPKLYRDVLKYLHGEVVAEDLKTSTTLVNLDDPLGNAPFTPSEQNPICAACDMFTHGCNQPFMPYYGSPDPVITFVFESVTGKEDTERYITAGGPACLLRKFVDAWADETGITSDDCRFITLTRCAHRMKQPLALRGKADKCRMFAVKDILEHPPRMVIPVGSLALGMFSHKSNAQDWSGRTLVYRGWPDDWLTNPNYVKPRKIKVGEQEVEVTGHPLFGAPPGYEKRCILYPLQAPRLIYMQQNILVEEAWKRQILRGLKLARDGVSPPNYNLPHYVLLTDKVEVIAFLQYVIDHPGMTVTYDTETEGLHPFRGDRVVFMMFRFIDPETKEPVAFGFPWHYGASERGPASPLLPHLKEIRPYVERALAASRVTGHNLTFDVLFTFCNLTPFSAMRAIDRKGRIRAQWREAMQRLNRLADAAVFDTWHMAYCRRQARGSLGLERIAYDFVPELAGYEEDMTMLIELDRWLLHPEEGGHYARCPQALWESHFKAYVMGDVEVCGRAQAVLEAKLLEAKVYSIPIAHPEKRGFFRFYAPRNRAWLYEKIMSPAARILMKLMGRGMYIDGATLQLLEDHMPVGIRGTVDKMKEVGSGQVLAYIAAKQAQEPGWELDLDKKDHLRDVLFNVLKLPIQRLTKTGRKLYGEESDGWAGKIKAALRDTHPELVGQDLVKAIEGETLKYAALDKFTLNKLAVDHDEVRPLQDYRKIHKLYSTYVRPLRNVFNASVDKKRRSKTAHLCPGWLIHAWFLLTGTRGGRLSCRDPNLQQLPKKAFDEFNVKEMYVSRFGRRGCLYGADFSQIELRLLAALSGDRSMVNAYLNDIDLHTLTASRLFNLPYETFSKDSMRKVEAKDPETAKDLKLKRDIAKTCNFLTGYGGGAFGLQTVLANNQVYWPIEDCERLIRLFFESYPAVKDLLAYYKKFIQSTNTAVSIFGRVRVFEEANSDDPEISSKALRAGCNHLIQSTASDMMLITLVIIEDLMRKEGLESILVSTVHDSLVIDALRSELPQIHGIVDTVLNNMPDFFKAYLGEDFDTSWMIVPFAGDSEVGTNYAAMRGIPKDNIDWDKLLSNKAA